MAGGLAALLDDIALIARNAAANLDDVAAAAGRTSAKAAGVVVDDAAVTPRFVQGVTPARELPIIWRISRGSLINKLVFILPLALLLSWLAPWALMPLLMIGGLYLCYEAAEKISEKLLPGRHAGEAVASERAEKSHPDPSDGAGETPANSEDALVKSAVMTDFILSAEIMVISLNEVATEPFLRRTLVLVVVALLITAAVYGAVGVLVKIDDIGLHLMQSSRTITRRIGKALVWAMPKLLTLIAIVGTLAMLWVGGHILVAGVDSVGWHAPHDLIHHAESLVAQWGGAATWLMNTACCLVLGLVVGCVLLLIVHPLTRLLSRRAANPRTTIAKDAHEH